MDDTSANAEKERTFVNVQIDVEELESIKAATRNSKNASAILSAARIGRDVLLRSIGDATATAPQSVAV